MTQRADRVHPAPGRPGGEPPDDGALVRKTLDGDVEAFGQLHDRYVRLVHSVCYDTTGGIEETRDLVQEVFLRAHRNLAQLREQDRFSSWLVAIAHRACRDWLRRKMRDRHEFVGIDPGGETLGDGPGADEDLERLRRAIKTLPENERVAVHLFYLDDQPVEAARKVLGLSRSGFYRVLERARERLRDILGPEAS